MISFDLHSLKIMQPNMKQIQKQAHGVEIHRAAVTCDGKTTFQTHRFNATWLHTYA